MEGAGFDWKGAPPSGHAKWITPLKNHLKEGGLADLRDRDGLIARVVGEVGAPQPRTVEAGAQLDVTLYIPASSSSSPPPLNAFEQAIVEHRAAFLSRTEGSHATWPTAFHFKLVPRLIPSDITPAVPAPLVASGGWLTYVSGWPTQIVSMCVWVYNTSVSLAITSGYYVLQASLVKWAWMYPVLLAPLGVGMVSLALVYNEVEFMDALWFVSQLLVNATFWVGGTVADRFGDPAGRVAMVTATIYALVLSVVIGLILMWLCLRALWRYITSAAIGVVFKVKSPSAPATKPGTAAPQHTSTGTKPDSLANSDSGSPASSDASLRLPGRRICQAHCIWLNGKQSDALHDTVCSGKNVKPSTLMYDDWFIQHGDRVRSANFPLVAELCAAHRLDYAGYKTKYKCTQLGCWRRGVPSPMGEGLECTLHAEVRQKVSTLSIPQAPVGVLRKTSTRHPATKSVKIHNVDSDSQCSQESEVSSHTGSMARRDSMDSNKNSLPRVSTGSDRTPVEMGRLTSASPSVLPTPQLHQNVAQPGERQKAYHFDDEPCGRASVTCDDLVSGHTEMAQTAHNLVSHGPPTRRHSVVARSPPPVAEIVHNVNTLTTPCFAPPYAYQGLVHGVVVGSTSDANLGSAPALVVGPISQRSSSLTHVAPSTAPPQGALANFYPDFLRKRVTPARHSVVADQVDKELLLTATEPVVGGREFSGLSEEIREFIKTTKEGNTGKDETWTRLTEMTGFSLGGFGFFQTRLGMGTYNRERKATILRQFATDKDALWDSGLRVPIGNRIAHAAAALTWGGDECG